jgi:hypothetical protein
MTYTTIAAAQREAGQVSIRNSKMPGSSFAATCHKCYAISIEKRYPSAHMGWSNNYLKATRMIEERPEQWAAAIKPAVIGLACELTPTIKHWLPTREAAVVKAFMLERAFPANLVVRVSSTMIDDAPIAGHAHTSTVHSKAITPTGAICEARSRGNVCGPCRACWRSEVKNISYPLH